MINYCATVDNTLPLSLYLVMYNDRRLQISEKPKTDMTMTGLNFSREMLSLRQRVTDGLREAILSGALQPGQKLIERELCEEMRISRTVLRESLQYLNAEGLVANVPRRGHAVASIDEKEVREIYRVRQILEALLGEDFANNATEDQIARLRGHIDALKSDGSATNFVFAEDEFYSILVKGCGNRIAGDVFKQLNNRITLLRQRVIEEAGGNNLLAELRAIAAAAEARDAELTGRLCAIRAAKAAEVASRIMRL